MNLWTTRQVNVVAKRLHWKQAPNESAAWQKLTDVEKREWIEQAEFVLEGLAEASGVEYAANPDLPGLLTISKCHSEEFADRQVAQWREQYGPAYADAHVIARVKAGEWVRRDPKTYQSIGTDEGETNE